MNLDFLKEDSSYSTMRMAFLFTIFVFYTAFTIVWAWVSLHNMALSPVPDGVKWLLGIPMVSKVGQKAFEVAPDVAEKLKGTAPKADQ